MILKPKKQFYLCCSETKIKLTGATQHRRVRVDLFDASCPFFAFFPPLIYLGKRGGIYVWTSKKEEQELTISTDCYYNEINECNAMQCNAM